MKQKRVDSQKITDPEKLRAMLRQLEAARRQLDGAIRQIKARLADLAKR